MNILPKFKVGDTIYWYCNDEDCVHNAEVQYVNFIKLGGDYLDINYEVEAYCKGQMRTIFVDEEDAVDQDFSL